VAKYLLDSDVLIWILRNRHETVLLVDRLVQDTSETLACSVLSVLEVCAGAKAPELQRTTTLIESLNAIPVDFAVARLAADLLRAHRRAGDPREWVDALIAATALQHQLTLVTYNQRDYPYANLRLYPLAA
jgi:predicted nucleic acid-binding protein